MSRCLTERSIDHVLLERGEVANSWRTRSLGLAPPAHTQLAEPPARLPLRRRRPRRLHDHARGRSATSTRYAEVAAPVETNTTVTSVRAEATATASTTTEGEWRCRTVVLASGACNLADVPAVAEAVPACVTTLTPADYRNPDQLADGRRADRRRIRHRHPAGRRDPPIGPARDPRRRRVTSARPRTYRGMDIMWWLDAAGILDERYDQVDDIVRARSLPSFQLIGSPSRATHRPERLQRSASGSSAGSPASTTASPSSRARCATNARSPTSSSDGCSTRSTSGLTATASTTRPNPRMRFDADAGRANHPPLLLDLTPRARSRPIIWATGYRPDHSWLDVPVLDHQGPRPPRRRRHRRPRPVPARARRSCAGASPRLIDGVGDDADELSAHLARHLADVAKPASRAVARLPEPATPR